MNEMRDKEDEMRTVATISNLVLKQVRGGILTIDSRAVRGAVAALGAIAAIAIGSEQASAAAGALDSAFGTGGVFSFPGAADEGRGPVVASQPDGKVILVVDTGADATVLRLNADGAPDPTFDGDGRATIDSGAGAGDDPYAVALQADGKIVIAGVSAPTSGGEDPAAFRLNPDGTPDATFGTNGVRVIGESPGNAAAFSLALQPDGRILLGGAADNKPVVYRLRQDGVFLDASFGSGGSATINIPGWRADEMALQPDGKILIASRTGTGPAQNLAVMRLPATGGNHTPSPLDSSFDTDGVAGIDGGGADSVGGLALQPDGKIVVAGATTIGAGGGSATVFRLSPNGGDGSLNGALDRSFDANGIALVDGDDEEAATALALRPDGKIVLAGAAIAAGPTADASVYRLLADGGPGPANGALDPGFGTAGTVTIDRDLVDFFSSVALQPDGKVVVAGYSGSVSPADAVAYRLLGDDPPATPAQPDTTPPDTEISKGPKRKTTQRKAKIAFTSSEPGSSFECALDKGKFKPCTSPRKLKRLDPARHRFRVRAIDVAGNTDPTPAKTRWKVLG
jgi:uncharacterized delta-60 repeat protein